jgi:heavy metal translocating P-type ATPase
MVFAIAVNTSEVSTGERRALQGVTLMATLAVSALLAKPLIAGSWASLRRRQVTTEVLFVLSYLGALGVSTQSMVQQRGPVFWEVAGILLVVYSLGRAIGRYTQNRIVLSLAEWNPVLTFCDRIGENGSVSHIQISELRPGDLVRVHPGETVPIDGRIARGSAFVRETEISGESFAVSRSEGDIVSSGTMVLDATIEVSAMTTGSERRVDRIRAALESVEEKPAHAQILANRIMQWFVPLLVCSCAAAALYWYVRAGTYTALFNAMAMLLVACPCALGFATPVSVWCAMNRLNKLGLLVKNGAAIEKLASVDTVVFDKTGTLTVPGSFSAHLELALAFADQESLIRSLVATVEHAASHPVAVALRGIGRANPAFTVESIKILPAVGLRATVADVRSSVRWTIQIGAAASLWKAQASETDPAHRLAVIVDGSPAAIIRLEEQACDALPDALSEIERSGLRCILMTGDAAIRAGRIPVATQYARLTPEGKLELCRELGRNSRRVAYVGDGLNDAAAMAASSVSIAVAGGSSLAAEVADVVWTQSRLTALSEAFSICREARRTIRATIAIALAYNAIGIALAAAGLLHPVAATLLMTASSCIVTFRALRLCGAEVPEARA